MVDFKTINKKERPKERNINLAIPAFIIIGITCFVFLISAFYTVDAGESAVLLTFGKASLDAKGEGFHLKFPIVQKVIKMETRTQKYTTPASAASKDLQIVSTELAVNYKLLGDEIPEIYRTLGLSYTDRIIQPAVQEVIKSTTAKYTAEELITKRSQVSNDIAELLTKKLNVRNIIVESISITNFDFSGSFNEAIEAKVTAEQQKLKAEWDLERIEVEAKQLKASALGKKEAAIAEAEGQARAIELIEQQLKKSPQYIEYFKLQKWDGQVSKVVGGTSLIGVTI